MRRNLLSKAVFLAVVSFSSMPFAQAQGGYLGRRNSSKQ